MRPGREEGGRDRRPLRGPPMNIYIYIYIYGEAA